MLKQIPDLVRGGVLDKVIPSFDYLVYLFMIISGFGMCNGYYQKLKTGTYSIDAFYSKRYKRTVPFFALLIKENEMPIIADKDLHYDSFSLLKEKLVQREE